MRLWSIHPCYLDAKGLVALWREGLLAQKVLQGKTKGYRNHPQLIRFRNTANPVGAIAYYLDGVANEADERDYKFDRSKILNKGYTQNMTVTKGQLAYEFSHLLKKLEQRSPKLYMRWKNTEKIKPHPVFSDVDGDVEDWEVI